MAVRSRGRRLALASGYPGLMPTYADPQGGRTLPAEALRTWTAAVLEAHETPPDIAADVAAVDRVLPGAAGLLTHTSTELGFPADVDSDSLAELGEAR